MSQQIPAAARDASMAQLRLFKSLTVILAILLLAGAGFFVYKQRQIQPVAILVNGAPVTTVENVSEANALLAKVTRQKAGEAFDNAKSKPQRIESVQIQRIPENQQVTLDSDDTAYGKLTSQIHVTVVGYAIVVDKQPVVVLPTEDDANEALDAVRNHYANMPPNDPIIDKPTFKEKVKVARMRVAADLVKQTAADAAFVLYTPPPPSVYTVAMHETGWSISRKFHMDFKTFLESNAGRDINKLHPGDQVNVSKTTPILTVIVVKQSSHQETIRPGVPADEAGLRLITTQTTYIDGDPLGPGTAVNVETVRRAKPSRSIM